MHVHSYNTNPATITSQTLFTPATMTSHLQRMLLQIPPEELPENMVQVQLCPPHEGAEGECQGGCSISAVGLVGRACEPGYDGVLISGVRRGIYIRGTTGY